MGTIFAFLACSPVEQVVFSQRPSSRFKTSIKMFQPQTSAVLLPPRSCPSWRHYHPMLPLVEANMCRKNTFTIRGYTVLLFSCWEDDESFTPRHLTWSGWIWSASSDWGGYTRHFFCPAFKTHLQVIFKIYVQEQRKKSCNHFPCSSRAACQTGPPILFLKSTMGARLSV